MIRRNVASQVIYLPRLALTADGSAVTSGASIVVAKDGTEAAGSGTLTHYSGGVWKYTPTQAETDAAIVALILTAIGADPVVLNLVTTAANTAAARFGAAAAGDEMGLTPAVLTALFADVDTAALVASIVAQFNEATDLPVDTIAALAASRTVTALASLISDAAAAKAAAQSADDKLTSGRLSRVDRLPDVIPGTTGGLALHGATGGGGAGDAEQATLIEVQEAVDSIAVALAGGSPVEPTGVSMREQLTEIHEAVFPPDPEDSPLVITPDDPGRVTGYAVCYGLDGEPASGIVVTYKLQSPPPRDVGRILNGSTTGTRTSASNGVITFPGLFPGSTYYFTCGSTQVSVTIPLDADPDAGFELPSFTRT